MPLGDSAGPVRPVLPLWAALLVAAASGRMLDLGLPDVAWWPATLLGIAMVLVSLIGRRNGSALLVGYVAGAVFWLVSTPWLALFVRDPTPWLAAALFEALFVAAGSLLITLAYRWVPRAFPGLVARVALLPVVVAGLWTAREGLAGVWPFGGFNWGRVGFTQSQGPLAQLYSWIGSPGMSFLLVLLVAVVIELGRSTPAGMRLRVGAAVAAVATVAALIPAFPVATEGTMRVAAVQGDGRAGYYDRAPRPELLRAQVDATLPLVDAARLDPASRPDVVVWPEGGSDVDPGSVDSGAQMFDYLSRSLQAPLVAGTITQRGEAVFNTSLVWEAGKGVTDYYDKRHPVPFGEYVPLRSIIEPIVPELIGLIGREYTPGSTDPVARIGDVTVGLNICFDIVDDALLRETVADGAQIVFTQSNNADFGDTDESIQQLEIARVRALETGRSVVVISTVGQSAIIEADGATVDSIPRYEPGAMVDDVPLSTTVTPAVLAGRALELLVSSFALLALALSRLLESRLLGSRLLGVRPTSTGRAARAGR